MMRYRIFMKAHFDCLCILLFLSFGPFIANGQAFRVESPDKDIYVLIDAKVGDYVIIARRSGTRWFLGGMTDWSSREFTVDLSFLTGDTYEYDLYQDGINSDRYAGDFIKTSGRISSRDQLTVRMSPGGGVAAVFSVNGK